MLVDRLEGQTAAGCAFHDRRSMADQPRLSPPERNFKWFALFWALALALLGGAPYLGVWEAAGNMADPNGVTTNTGGHFDPTGSSAEGDAGNMWDPDG